MMKKNILFSLFLYCYVGLSAQTVSNVQVEQLGKKIIITYDLDKASAIAIRYSTDGGKTYSAPLKQVVGDVGKQVSSGHKTITWNVLEEVDELIGSNIVFQVISFARRGLENGHEWVDLGLSVKWATYNVGATNVGEYGNLYAWGETSPKDTYRWNTYKYCKGSYDTMTKYCNDSNFGYNEFSDNKTILEKSDDAANANWGGNWRMPTQVEFLELVNNCEVTWTSDYKGTGLAGFIFTSKNIDYMGNTVFLPAVGANSGMEIRDIGSYGGYWLSTLFENDARSAWLPCFILGNMYKDQFGHRCYGHSVRAVLSK